MFELTSTLSFYHSVFYCLNIGYLEIWFCIVAIDMLFLVFSGSYLETVNERYIEEGGRGPFTLTVVFWHNGER